MSLDTDEEKDDREPLDCVEEACRRYFPYMFGLRAVKEKSYALRLDFLLRMRVLVEEDKLDPQSETFLLLPFFQLQDAFITLDWTNVLTA